MGLTLIGASFPDSRYSFTGVAITPAGDMLLWRSSEQKTHALSSVETEFMAAPQASRDLK